MSNLKQPDIWNAVNLFSKLFPLKTTFFWEASQLNYNTNKWELRLWYAILFSACFLYGCCLPIAVILADPQNKIPLLVLIIFGISAVTSLITWIQVFVKLESGKSFVYGFNQMLALQRTIFKSKFLQHTGHSL